MMKAIPSTRAGDVEPSQPIGPAKNVDDFEMKLSQFNGEIEEPNRLEGPSRLRKD